MLYVDAEKKIAYSDQVLGSLGESQDQERLKKDFPGISLSPNPVPAGFEDCPGGGELPKRMWLGLWKGRAVVK